MVVEQFEIEDEEEDVRIEDAIERVRSEAVSGIEEERWREEMRRKKRPCCLHVEVALDEDKLDLVIGLKPTRLLPIGLDVCRVQDGLHLRVHRPPASSQPMASASWGLRIASHPTWSEK